MVSDSGALFDTRKPDWHKLPPLRPDYQAAHRTIGTTTELLSTLRTKYVWPGGYEIVFITSDGALLCWDCVRANLRSVLDSIRHQIDDGWRVDRCAIEAVDADMTRECDPELVSYCAHCNREFGELD